MNHADVIDSEKREVMRVSTERVMPPAHLCSADAACTHPPDYLISFGFLFSSFKSTASPDIKLRLERRQRLGNRSPASHPSSAGHAFATAWRNQLREPLALTVVSFQIPCLTLTH